MQTPKIIHRCIACHAPLSKPLFTMYDMPAGAFYLPSEEELKEDKGVTLPLCRCENCGLFQLDTEPVSYYRDAIRVAGLSETMSAQRREDFKQLIAHYDLAGKKWIECGCGNGDFLLLLKDFPVDIYGTENNENNILTARKKLNLSSSHIIRFFPERADLKISGGPFDSFLSLNFLEHQPDPFTMLKCLFNNLKEGGIGLITVPSFEYTLKYGTYFEIVRDHIGNYDKNSLKNLILSCGFDLLRLDTIGIGDTLRAIVKKPALKSQSCQGKMTAKSAVMADKSGSESFKHFSPGKEVVNENETRIKEEQNEDVIQLKEEPDENESSCDELAKMCLKLKDNYLKMSEKINEFTDSIKSQQKSLALFAAGHKGLALAATSSLGSASSYIIDSSPKKQGLFSPVSHLRIVPPEYFFSEPVDVILITEPGFIPEIKKVIALKYSLEKLREARPGSTNPPEVRDITEFE